MVLSAGSCLQLKWYEIEILLQFLFFSFCCLLSFFLEALDFHRLYLARHSIIQQQILEKVFLVFFPSYKLQNRFSGFKFNEYKRIFHEKFICHANKQLPNCTNSYSTNRLSISLKLNISKIKLMSYII